MREWSNRPPWKGVRSAMGTRVRIPFSLPKENIMKFFLTLLLILTVKISWSCEVNIIAFKGLGDQFDNNAFQFYTNKHRGCGHVYKWQETNKALTFINSSSTPYQLYGYSKGAESIRSILKKVNHLPVYVITIGAWKTVDLDFTKYNIGFQNYFDASGLGQQSPGVYLKDVQHYQMQESVNRILWKIN